MTVFSKPDSTLHDTEGDDISSKVFQNMMDSANNYSEIEAAPQYDVTGHQTKFNDPVRDFGPYSDLELSQPPPSHNYELTSTSRDQRLNQTLPQDTGFNETYSALEESDSKEYDATHSKEHKIKLKYPASDTQGFDSCYSDLEGLLCNDYDTTNHTRKEQMKLLGILDPDVYSSINLSHDEYDVTAPMNKDSNTEMKPAIILGVPPNDYSKVQALMQRKAQMKRKIHPSNCPPLK